MTPNVAPWRALEEKRRGHPAGGYPRRRIATLDLDDLKRKITAKTKTRRCRVRVPTPVGTINPVCCR